MYKWALLESPEDSWAAHDWMAGTWSEERDLVVSGALTAFWECAYVAVLKRDMSDGHGWEDPMARLRAREWLAKVGADPSLLRDLASCVSTDNDGLLRLLDSEEYATLLSNSPQLRATLDRKDYEPYLDTIEPRQGLWETWGNSGYLLSSFLQLHERWPDLDASTITLLAAGVIALAVADSWLAADESGQGVCLADVDNSVAAALDATQSLSLVLHDDEPRQPPTNAFLVPTKQSGCMVVGQGKRGYSVAVAASLVWLVHAQQQAERGFFHEAFEYGSRAMRSLIDLGSDRDPLILGSIKGPERASYMPLLRSWLEAARTSGARKQQLPSLTAAVEGLSFALECKMEQRLLSGEVCPDWLIDEVDYWAKVDAPSANADALQLRRDSAALRSDVLARAPLRPEPSRFPPIRNNLAFQMLKWAADECYVDYGDIDGLFLRLATDPANRTAAAGLFWTCQYLLEHDLLDGEQVDPGLLLEQDEVHRPLLGPDWEQGVVLMHWDQIFRLREQPMLQADGFLDWAEPLAERDPAVVVMYGAAVLSLMVSAARERAGVEGILYYHEDLRRVIEVTAAANRLVDQPWFLSDASPQYTYYWRFTSSVFGSDRLAFTLSAARLLADLELGFLLSSQGDAVAAFEACAGTIANLLDDGILIDGLHIPCLGGPFATESHCGAFAEVRHWFEATLAAPESVSGWDSVAMLCFHIHAYLKYDVEWHRETGNDVPEWERDERSYWDQAEKLASKRLSPDQLVRTLQRHDVEVHRARLSRDVLHDTWDILDRRTQSMLMTLERNWYDSIQTPGALADVPNELRKIFELELRLCLMPLKKVIEDILWDRDLKRELRVRSWTYDSLSLGDMARMLRMGLDNKALRALTLSDALASMPINDNERQFLTVVLPRYLDPLWDSRNDAEHEFRWDDKRIALHRRRALGVDCRGMLAELLRIKRKLRGAPQASSDGPNS